MIIVDFCTGLAVAVVGSWRDAPVVEYLSRDAMVAEMEASIASFLETWLPRFQAESRPYLTVALGCTGGQHRSVYLAEWLGRAFRGRARVLTRHRALAGT